MTDPVYHPVAVVGGLSIKDGYFDGGSSSAVGYGVTDAAPSLDDPDFGTTLYLHNRRPCPVGIHGVRALNRPWEVVILSLGPVRGPFDAAAFNLDAVPGPPAGAGHRYPTPEKPRFVHYPIGILEPDEKMPVRACPYGTPSQFPTLNLLFFVKELPADG